MSVIMIINIHKDHQLLDRKNRNKRERDNQIKKVKIIKINLIESLANKKLLM